MKKVRGIAIALVLLIVSFFLVTFMSEGPKPHTFQFAPQYVNDNHDTIVNISAAAKAMLSDDYPYMICKNGDIKILDQSHNAADKALFDMSLYTPLEQFLTDNEFIYMIEKEKNGIWFYSESGENVLYSETDPENVQPPADYMELDWSRVIDGDEITLISDNRGKNGTLHKGMYYRVDMQYMGDHLFIYYLTSKYPWYSYLIG